MKEKAVFGIVDAAAKEKALKEDAAKIVAMWTSLRNLDKLRNSTNTKNAFKG